MEDHEKQGKAMRAAKSLDRKFDSVNICDIFDQDKAGLYDFAFRCRIYHCEKGMSEQRFRGCDMQNDRAGLASERRVPDLAYK